MMIVLLLSKSLFVHAQSTRIDSLISEVNYYAHSFTGGANDTTINLNHLKLANAKIILLDEAITNYRVYKQAYKVQTERIRYIDSIMYHQRKVIARQDEINKHLIDRNNKVVKQRNRLIGSTSGLGLLLILVILL